MNVECNANGIAFDLQDDEVFRNGNLAVFDRDGRQVPELQGAFWEVLKRLSDFQTEQGEL
jgi:hypothetical protein